MVSVGVVCVALMTAAGAASITTGWTPPFGVLVPRPRLWGAGVLLSACGLSVFLFLGPLGHMPPRAPYVPLVGMAVNLVGMAVQSLARRPVPPSTGTAS